MVQAAASPLTFDEFIECYPEDGGCYELRHGVMVEMRPIGPHEEVIALIRRKLDVEIERQNLPLFIPQSCLIKPLRVGEGYLPDIIVLDQEKVKTDPYWKKYSSLSTGDAIKLIVEVVSTNWQDDYLIKLAEYEKLGVPEYWIVDYRAMGGVRFIGSPKMPMVWIYKLGDQEYQPGQPFQVGQRLISPTFPELMLEVDRIIETGQEPLIE
jgi:Uma2 family endonuclease